MPCGTCRHWMVSANDGQLGVCRGTPPAPAHDDVAGDWYAFPTTPHNESCGLFVKRLAPKKVINPVKRRHSETDTDVVAATIDAIWQVYPAREMPHPFIPARKAINELLDAKVDPDILIRAAETYAAQCRKDGTEKKYVKSLHKFFEDDFWQGYCEITVNGLTRSQWTRNGLDVAQFDMMLDAMARDKDPVDGMEPPF
jgi:hypothetical protein